MSGGVAGRRIRQRVLVGVACLNGEGNGLSHLHGLVADGGQNRDGVGAGGTGVSVPCGGGESRCSLPEKDLKTWIRFIKDS